MTHRPTIVPSATGHRQVVPAAQPMGIYSVSLVLLTAMLWGATSVAAKFSLETLPPIAIAAIRFSLASLCMLIWCWITGISLMPRRHEWAMATCAGLLMAAQILFFYWGVQYSNASHGTILIQTSIFFVLIIEHFVTQSDRLTLLKICGLIIAALSVLAALATAYPDEMVTTLEDPDQPRLLGDTLMLISALLLSIKIIVVKYSVERMNSAKLILWHNVVGVVCFFACSFILEGTAPWSPEHFSVTTILSLLYQGILVAGFCFAMHAWLLQFHSATQLAVFGFTTPLFGLVVAMSLRHDPVSPWLVVAGLGVAVGIYLVNQR